MPTEPLGKTSFLTVSCLKRAVPKSEYCECASDAGASSTAGADAAPSSSLPEKHSQIGLGAFTGARLTVLGHHFQWYRVLPHFGRLGPSSTDHVDLRDTALKSL